jgi:predicted SprT family Zn-dependent metalloprotease
MTTYSEARITKSKQDFFCECGKQVRKKSQIVANPGKKEFICIECGKVKYPKLFRYE